MQALHYFYVVRGFLCQLREWTMLTGTLCGYPCRYTALSDERLVNIRQCAKARQCHKCRWAPECDHPDVHCRLRVYNASHSAYILVRSQPGVSCSHCSAATSAARSARCGLNTKKKSQRRPVWKPAALAQCPSLLARRGHVSLDTFARGDCSERQTGTSW